MNRLDWFITKRLALRILAVVALFFALIALSESLDSSRFDRIANSLGEFTAWLSILTSASRWAIKTLSVTVLVGSIVALLEFQAQREFVVIKASGISVWRIMRGPILFIIMFGLVVSFAVETASTSWNRAINPTPPGIGGGVSRSTTQVWLAQEDNGRPYIINAESARERGTILQRVTLIPQFEADFRRIYATRAEFSARRWILSGVILTHFNGSTSTLDTYEIGTLATEADLRLIVGSTEDFTLYELVNVLKDGITEPVVRSAALTRFFKLISMPALLVGSLLIAFAFTAGYRRDNNYGLTIIYGIVLGFVVFLLTEMADRAGSSGVLDASYATWGPALVSILIGVSVLLHKEDGRA